MFWGTRATNFDIYTTEMKGAGPKILGTGTKFKREYGAKKVVQKSWLMCLRGFDDPFGL